MDFWQQGFVDFMQEMVLMMQNVRPQPQVLHLVIDLYLFLKVHMNYFLGTSTIGNKKNVLFRGKLILYFFFFC